MFFEVTFGSLSVPKGILGLILGGTEKRRKKGTEAVSRILRKGGGCPINPSLLGLGSWVLVTSWVLGPGGLCWCLGGGGWELVTPCAKARWRIPYVYSFPNEVFLISLTNKNVWDVSRQLT